MDNKVLDFILEKSKKEELMTSHEFRIYSGSKEIFNEILKKYPTERHYHLHIDSGSFHNYELVYGKYPYDFKISITVNYDKTEMKERAREIALKKAEETATNACMQKWRETQKRKEVINSED